MMLYGGNGDFPRMILLAPGDPGDCFEIGIAG